MTKIIAFSGRKQSGKTSSGDYIQSLLDQTLIQYDVEFVPLKYKIYSFADPLKKDICMNILGLTEEQCNGSDIDKNTLTDLVWNGEPLTARRAMEVVGTDIFRSLKRDVWVSATMRNIKRDQYDVAIILDVRFPNEVEAIKKLGGYVIRLTLDPFCSESQSEKALDQNLYDWSNFDYIIDNSNMTMQEKNLAIHKFCKDKHIIG